MYNNLKTIIFKNIKVIIFTQFIVIFFALTYFYNSTTSNNYSIKYQNAYIENLNQTSFILQTVNPIFHPNANYYQIDYFYNLFLIIHLNYLINVECLDLTTIIYLALKMIQVFLLNLNFKVDLY